MGGSRCQVHSVLLLSRECDDRYWAVIVKSLSQQLCPQVDTRIVTVSVQDLARAPGHACSGFILSLCEHSDLRQGLV